MQGTGMPVPYKNRKNLQGYSNISSRNLEGLSFYFAEYNSVLC